jgi:hypothetical protein
MLGVAGMLLCMLSGCGAGGGSVSGTITYQGKPLPTGAVTFSGGENGSVTVSSPITDGKYAMTEVPVGPVKISVTTPPPSPPPPPGTPAAAPATETIPIPQKYAFADQSGLTYTVKSGAQTYDIKLE